MGKGNGDQARAGLELTKKLEIPQKGFRKIGTPYGTLFLPKDTKHQWSHEERPFRSLILNEQGEVVSMGFPKFANLGEPGFEDHQEDLVRDLACGKVWLTEKLDGSLVIRSVINGEVTFRTRGSDKLNAFHSPVMAQVEKYPILMDPSFYPDSSLHFEFLSKDFRVVLGYPEDRLTLIGGVNHKSLKLFDKPELERLSKDHDLELVETLELSGSLKELKKEVGSWAGREGLVARAHNGQSLVKLKSPAYIALHRLRTSFSVRAIKRMCLNEKLNSEAKFEKYLKKLGADWEILEDAKPVIKAAMQARERAEVRSRELEDELDMLFIKNPGNKKAVIAAIQSYPEAERQAALLLADNRYVEATSALDRLMLEEALAPFQDKELALMEDVGEALVSS